MKDIIELYFNLAKQQPEKITKLSQQGSNRQYYRLENKNFQPIIAVKGTNIEENKAFQYIAKHFSKQGISVPKIHCFDKQNACYLQEDLGDLSLFDAIKDGRNNGGNYSNREIKLISKAIKELPKIQFIGAKKFQWSKCFQIKEFDKQSILFDLNYFKYCFLKASGIEFNEVLLEKNFQALTKQLLSEKTNTFMYRDFQARNIMLKQQDTPYFIDFQGGRKGIYYYDVVSFLWQASANYSETLRNKMIKEYYEELKNYTSPPDYTHFINKLYIFALFRMLQVLGAYGFRGNFEGKTHFINSIPSALKNIENLIPKLADNTDIQYILEVIYKLIEIQNTKKIQINENDKDLTVMIYSFSYKKGVPVDFSGNGGGYVFDCRAIHNPGRYTQYKTLTGLDIDVKNFLEKDKEILSFLESVYKLADKHIETYIKRKFTNLMFCFGCTGGQHRSVYSAQHLAEYIHKKYNIKVHLIHREQNIDIIFTPE